MRKKKTIIGTSQHSGQSLVTPLSSADDGMTTTCIKYKIGKSNYKGRECAQVQAIKATDDKNNSTKITKSSPALERVEDRMRRDSLKAKSTQIS